MKDEVYSTEFRWSFYLHRLLRLSREFLKTCRIGVTSYTVALPFVILCFLVIFCLGCYCSSSVYCVMEEKRENLVDVDLEDCLWDYKIHGFSTSSSNETNSKNQTDCSSDGTECNDGEAEMCVLPEESNLKSNASQNESAEDKVLKGEVSFEGDFSGAVVEDSEIIYPSSFPKNQEVVAELSFKDSFYITPPPEYTSGWSNYYSNYNDYEIQTDGDEVLLGATALPENVGATALPENVDRTLASEIRKFLEKNLWIEDYKSNDAQKESLPDYDETEVRNTEQSDFNKSSSLDDTIVDDKVLFEYPWSKWRSEETAVKAISPLSAVKDGASPAKCLSEELNFNSAETGSICTKDILDFDLEGERNDSLDPTGVYSLNPLSDLLPNLETAFKHGQCLGEPLTPKAEIKRRGSVPTPSTGAIPKDWEVIRNLPMNRHRSKKNKNKDSSNNLGSEESLLEDFPESPIPKPSESESRSGSYIPKRHYFDNITNSNCATPDSAVAFNLAREKFFKRF